MVLCNRNVFRQDDTESINEVGPQTIFGHKIRLENVVQCLLKVSPSYVLLESTLDDREQVCLNFDAKGFYVLLMAVMCLLTPEFGDASVFFLQVDFHSYNLKKL